VEKDHLVVWCKATGRGAGWSPVDYGVRQSTTDFV